MIALSVEAAVVLIVVLVVVLIVVVLNVWARGGGYSIPGRSPVRCSKGHLFLATWVMGGSLTRVRLGPLTRWGRCPVGHHWTTMRPIKEDELTQAEGTSLYGKAGR
jgi:hypothetical protein